MDKVEQLAFDFCNGRYDFKEPDDIWPKVFEYLTRNSADMIIDRDAVHTLWTVNGGHLRNKVRNDGLVRDVLREFLPGYVGQGLTLYRGECKFLFDANKIGFCWTPFEQVAKVFARGLNAPESGGVLLTAFAPTEAILAPPNEHSSKQMDEHEYTCDPKLLVGIKVIETYPKC